MDPSTLTPSLFRAWLLEHLRRELDAFDHKTVGLSEAERQDWDAALDADLDALAPHVESHRPTAESDELANAVLRPRGLSLEALADPQPRQTVRAEALTALAELLVLKSESVMDWSRRFPQRAKAFRIREANAVAATAAYPQAGPLSVEAVRQMRGLDIEGGKKTVSQLFTDYFEAHRGKWKNHDARVRNDYGPVRDLFMEVTSDIPIERLTLKHVRDFADRIKASGAASGTIDKKLNRLAAVLRWAHEQGILDEAMSHA